MCLTQARRRHRLGESPVQQLLLRDRAELRHGAHRFPEANRFLPALPGPARRDGNDDHQLSVDVATSVDLKTTASTPVQVSMHKRHNVDVARKSRR